MDPTTFSKDDVRQHLTELGYKNIPDEKLDSFLKDLRRLIKHEEKKKRIDQKLSLLEHQESNLPNPGSERSRHQESNLPNTSSSLDSASKLQAKTSPRKPRRVKRLSESQERQNIHKKSGPKVTIALDEESFGASYEESGSGSSRSSKSSSSKTSSSSSSSSRSRSVDERDIDSPDNATQEASSLYIDINLKKRPASASSVSLLPNPSKGFIRCRSANAIKPGVGARDARTDPVKLHQKYAQSWAKLNLPGETSHNKLRWAVREWMMGEEPS